jgi:hypothetical protein
MTFLMHSRHQKRQHVYVRVNCMFAYANTSFETIRAVAKFRMRLAALPKSWSDISCDINLVESIFNSSY